MATVIGPKEREREIFSVGSPVEIMLDDDGLEGAWFPAKILKTPPSSRATKKWRNKFLVECLTLLHSRGETPLREYTTPRFMRPLPPTQNPNESSFEVSDVVDAYYNDGWWKGVVAKVNVSSKNYTVKFDTPPEYIDFAASELRMHMDWKDGKWVESQRTKRRKDLQFSSGMAVEVHIKIENSAHVWFPGVVKEFGFSSSLVMYNDESGPVHVTVDSSCLRPTPPKIEVDDLVVMEYVEAFYCSGWREGYISKVLTGRKYIVFLSKLGEKEFTHSMIRPDLCFVNGNWVPKTKQTKKQISWTIR